MLRIGKSFLLVLLAAIMSCEKQDENIAPEPEPIDYPGIVDDSHVFNGKERRYVLHIPDDHDGTSTIPLVIFLHGGGGNAESAQNFTNFNNVSENEGFLIAYPEAFFESAPNNFVWADGRGLAPDKLGIDDVGFVNSLTSTLMEEYNINSRKVYLCGFSNGSFLTQRIAFEANQLYAAIGTLGGTMSISQYESGDPERAIPMMYVFGTDDPLVPYEGGFVSGNPNLEEVVSAEAAVDFWVQNNDCTDSSGPTELPDLVSSDNSTVTVFEYTQGDNGSAVIFYRVNGAGHTWPGVLLPGQEALGATNLDILASSELWHFFDQFELQ